MTQIIGLAGPARSGKDTVADHLVKNHGFLRFSFSDALYWEVSSAFDVSVEFLQEARNKEWPFGELALNQCSDKEFVRVATTTLEEERRRQSGLYLYPEGGPLSPRWILQTWGTEYRRAQDPDYWIRHADEWLDAAMAYGYDKFVNTSVRFPNEAAWLRSLGGQVWHVSRPSGPAVRSHSSEVPVPFERGDKRLMNTGTITQLWTMTTLLLSSPYESVWVEE